MILVGEGLGGEYPLYKLPGVLVFSQQTLDNRTLSLLSTIYNNALFTTALYFTTLHYGLQCEPLHNTIHTYTTL